MTVRAPGKLVLVGEYAVLDGGGAVVAAVDHGVSCVASPGAFEIRAPGDDRFVRAALAGAPAAAYTFADWNPVDLAGMKPGFGGSAAATVAAVVAAGLPPARAYAAHHAVQGGGSGVDIFASLLGGVRRFPDGAEVPCAVPPLAVWSGASASTGPRVARYRAWAGRAAFVEASRALVAAFADDPVGVTREAYALLRAMARDADLAYDTPAHARIAALAAAHGGAAKPSGAGGGDVAIAFVPDPDARARFATAVAAEGLLPIPVTVAPGAWSGPPLVALPAPVAFPPPLALPPA